MKFYVCCYVDSISVNSEVMEQVLSGGNDTKKEKKTWWKKFLKFLKKGNKSSKSEEADTGSTAMVDGNGVSEECFSVVQEQMINLPQTAVTVEVEAKVKPQKLLKDAKQQRSAQMASDMMSVFQPRKNTYWISFKRAQTSLTTL
ncbi:hypothetical protein QTP70_028264 [Hemibagrus guttatus]|uniref:Uncharacterized protein n=1 Tax=Hemibagrus guttatus TaxID=175788 RepID=A0AAE0QAT9_9TELE|nr:hypothetical protein QTP70_028264 [Hemibagrus guttatus]